MSYTCQPMTITIAICPSVAQSRATQ